MENRERAVGAQTAAPEELIIQRRRGGIAAVLATLMAALAASAAVSGAEPASPLVIRDVTVISPERATPLQHAYVRIRDGRIAEISDKPLAEKEQIDGRGRFLIPGLIDSHMHLGTVPGMLAPHRDAHPDIAAMADAQEPRSYLYFGFTTVLSLGATAPAVTKWNALEVRPDAYFCGGTPMVSGYSFQGFTETPYFLYNPDQLGKIAALIHTESHTPEAVVAEMARNGAICVKSYRESGFGRMAGQLPVPSVEMIQAVVKAAHARNMPVFLHANSKDAHAFAVQAGVDAIAHGMWNGHRSTPEKLDEGVEPILKNVLSRRMGYQPTSQVIRGLAEEVNDSFLDDPLLTHAYPAKLLAWYRSPEGAWFRKEELGDLAPRVFDATTRAGDAAVAYLARNNAQLLFGTDTPSAPVYTNPPGLNGFYEMRRWVAAGVSLKQLLHAATLENARIMRLDRDIGTVEKGKRAHLLLLGANPLESVEAYNSIETVFLAGRPIKREALSARNVSAK
jgi:imidazolonepropionase-like amidohydrolase